MSTKTYITLNLAPVVALVAMVLAGWLGWLA